MRKYRITNPEPGIWFAEYKDFLFWHRKSSYYSDFNTKYHYSEGSAWRSIEWDKEMQKLYKDEKKRKAQHKETIIYVE